MTKTLLRAGHALLESDSGGPQIVDNGSIVIDGETVLATGAFDDLARDHPDASIIGSPDHVLIPGLVDAHHHGIGLTQFQLGSLDGYLEPWVAQFGTLPRAVDPYADTLLAALRLIRSGVTSVAHFGTGRDPRNQAAEMRSVLAAYDRAGLRVSFGIHRLDRNAFVYQDDDAFLQTLPASLADRARDALAANQGLSATEFERVVDELLVEHADHPRITLALAAEGPEWCSDDLLKEMRRLANRLELPLQIHVAESAHQREYSLQEHGHTSVEHLDRIGFLGPDVLLAHAVWLSDADIKACASTGASIAHNPSSNLRLRGGILPLRALRNAGVNVALGTDSTALNDDDDMIQELRVAAKLHRLPQGLDRHLDAPSSQEILTMATTNGARALGPAFAGVGGLAAGGPADAVLINGHRMLGGLIGDVNIVDALLYRASAADVDTVVIAGRMVLSGGEFVELDEAQVLVDALAAARTEPPEHVRQWRELITELVPTINRFYHDWSEPHYTPEYTVNSPS